MKSDKIIEKNALTDKMKDDDFAGFGDFRNYDQQEERKAKKKIKPTSLSLDEIDLMNIEIIHEGLYRQDKIRRTNTEIMRIALRKLAEELKPSTSYNN